MAKSTDLDAPDVSSRAAATTARLLVCIEELGCAHVLNEKLQGLMVIHGLATDNEDWEGVQSALVDIEHWIMYPDSDD